jgi:hypothetical protein
VEEKIEQLKVIYSKLIKLTEQAGLDLIDQRIFGQDVFEQVCMAMALIKQAEDRLAAEQTVDLLETVDMKKVQ